jgi:hypothetical protein
VVAISKARAIEHWRHHYGAIAGPLNPMCCTVRNFGPVKTRGVRELRVAERVDDRSAKKKKPGTAGLPDESLFRSVHFASLAI